MEKCQNRYRQQRIWKKDYWWLALLWSTAHSQDVEKTCVPINKSVWAKIQAHGSMGIQKEPHNSLSYNDPSAFFTRYKRSIVNKCLNQNSRFCIKDLGTPKRSPELHSSWVPSVFFYFSRYRSYMLMLDTGTKEIKPVRSLLDQAALANNNNLKPLYTDEHYMRRRIVESHISLA